MFVGNHRSNFDPIIEWLVLKPWDIAFISKGENFKIPFSDELFGNAALCRSTGRTRERH